MNRRRFIQAMAGTQVGLPYLFATVSEKATRLSLKHPLPDPFCIRWDGTYYLTGTHSTGGPGNTGLAFDLLKSKDLEQWESLGPVLRIPDYEGSRKANYWAPEILPYEGRFYFYYTSDSFGDPYRRFVRVGVADRIEGPYTSDGKPLTKYPSIDGHPVLLSPTGGHLFYTGNEGNPHMGQLLVDRLVTPTRLADMPQKVFPRETVEWEEGSFLLKKADIFYLFTSQGNWRNETYHVLVSKSDSIAGPYTRLKDSQNRPVLKTNERQIGPGHNSLFEGPEGRTYICYHAWDQRHTGRYAWIAPLDWEDGYPRVSD